MAHHLDDVIEWRLYQMAKGHLSPRDTPYKNGRILRPFLATAKSSLEFYAAVHGVPYLEDPSNEDLKYSRNRIRHQVVPEMLKVNPGLYTVHKKALLDNLVEI